MKTIKCVVRSEKCVLGDVGARVDVPDDANTRALVRAGHLAAAPKPKPRKTTSKAAD